MRRYPPVYSSSYSFGPGPISTALKALILVNVGMFLATWVMPSLTPTLGLVPVAVVEQFRVWQLVT